MPRPACPRRAGRAEDRPAFAAERGFPDYAIANTGTQRGIQGGIGGGADSRWAIVYARVPDLDQAWQRAGHLGGSAASDPSLHALKSASRAALYGTPDESMKTGVFRDPAGNVFGVFSY